MYYIDEKLQITIFLIISLGIVLGRYNQELMYLYMVVITMFGLAVYYTLKRFENGEEDEDDLEP